jgi:hypothetical protein
VFAGSSAASAGGACTILTAPEHAAPARRLAVAGTVIQLSAGLAMRRRLDLVAEPYKKGRIRALATAARALTAAGGLTMLLAGRSRRGAGAAGGLLLAGSACERFAIFRAGFASADDPRYTIVPQRRRVADRRDHDLREPHA